MRYFVYNLSLYLLSPLIFFYLLTSRRNRGLLRRFKADLQTCSPSPVWLHACSVGEVGVALTLMKQMKERAPGLSFLLTVSTVSGMRQANAANPSAVLAYLPFDLPGLMLKFRKHYEPSALILIETEIWPNLVKSMQQAGRPVAVVNARLSDKHFPRYKSMHKLLPPVFPLLSMVCSQESVYSERFKELGVLEEAIFTTGNLKYDQRPPVLGGDEKEFLRKEIGIEAQDQVVIFGSTHPGEEKLAASCYERLIEEFPQLFLIVVPRHLDRTKAAMHPFEGIGYCRLSDLRAKKKPPSHSRVLFVDTMGELTKLYQISSVAVICGSFYAGVEGHNPLEAAVAAVPTVFGRHMESFKDAVKLLIEREGAFEVPQPEALLPQLQALLRDPALLSTTGNNAREAVKSNEGATKRTVDALFSVIFPQKGEKRSSMARKGSSGMSVL